MKLNEKKLKLFLRYNRYTQNSNTSCMARAIEAIEQFLKTRTPEQLSPDYLHAEISTSYYDVACETIKNIIGNGDRSGCLGISSTREHILHRAEYGTFYVVHFGHGKYKDAYYFTPSKMQMYFEYHDGVQSPRYSLVREMYKHSQVPLCRILTLAVLQTLCIPHYNPQPGFPDP